MLFLACSRQIKEMGLFLCATMWYIISLYSELMSCRKPGYETNITTCGTMVRLPCIFEAPTLFNHLVCLRCEHGGSCTKLLLTTSVNTHQGTVAHFVRYGKTIQLQSNTRLNYETVMDSNSSMPLIYMRWTIQLINLSIL